MSNASRGRPSLFWPLLLIGIGVILLLSNLGILPADSFNILWRFWPLVLVIIGLDILLGRRSAVGSIISSILVLALLGGVVAFVLFARNIPGFISEFGSSELHQEFISTPLEDFDSATVKIDWTSGPAKLYALSDSNNLLEGDIKYFGNLFFNVEPAGDHVEVDLDTRIEGFFFPHPGDDGRNRSWQIGLNPAIRLDLILDAGSGRGEYDLSRLNIESFNIDAGSGPLTITLPETGRIEGIIDGGSGPITLILPNSLEAQVTLGSGSGSFDPSSRFSKIRTGRDDEDVAVWVTDDFQGADNSIDLEIDPGSGPILIE
jgi:hypothetical protein